MKKLLTVLAFLIALSVSGQTFEEFKKEYEQGLKNFREQQNKRLQEMQKEYDAYVKQRDKEFAEYLKNYWKEFKVFKGEKPPERPKPKETPVFKPEERKEETINKIPVIEIKALPEEEQIILPLVQKSVPDEYNYLSGDIEYYSNEIDFEYDPEFLKCDIRTIDKNSIGEWWGKASETQYNHLINQLLSVKDRYALNDWGYYLLLKKVSNDIFSTDDNQANLMHWFLLVRSGYDIKLGFVDNKTTILIPSKQKIYRISYMTMQGKDYYVMQYPGQPMINTYEKTYPGSNRIMDLNIYYPLNLSNNKKTRTANITYKGKEYNINMAYNPDMINFLKDYPTTSLNVYFDAAVSAQAKDAFAESLSGIIENMSSDEAANFLLYLTQNAFEYKTDPEQFGEEKFLFPEETIHYPYSDCEDRSVFYAYLIKEFLKLDIVGLEYVGHIATAIKLDHDTKGDYVTFKDEKYIVADPTYVNAPVGLTMPMHKDEEARVIELNDFRKSIYNADKLWNIAHNAGAFRGGCRQDHVFDDENNCYLTGYFVKSADFGNKELASSSPLRQCFIAKFNKTGDVLWARNFDGNGISTGISLITENDGSPLIMGTYDGTINFEGKSVTSNGQDIFLLKLDKNGDPIWLNKAGLSSENTGMFLKYIITFGSNGEHINTDLFAESPASSSEGLLINNEGDIIIAGAFNSTTGMNTRDISFADVSEINYADMLKSENDELIKQDVEKTIAGLFATINLIKNSGAFIPGTAAQEALDKYNPDFKDECSDFYEKLGNINFLKNNEGVITIQTSDEGSVVFDKVKVQNSARVKISSYQNGNEQLDVLSGITVGKLFIWFDLNFVKMIRSSGDMLFDYDSDHTQKTMNFREDILRL